jgi:DNA-3-methyladenine glycosylase
VAVLLRALEPVEGIELMKRRRKKEDIRQLCNGPGKLVLAMGIGKELNSSSFFDGPLKIFSADEFGKPQKHQMITTTRVGITKAAEQPLRFYIKGSPYVSRK